MVEVRAAVLGGRAGQQTLGRLPDDQRATGGRENRHQANVALRVADFIPGNPHTVAGPKLRGAEVAGELLGSKGVLAVGCLAAGILPGVVVSIDDELPFHGDGMIRGIVEVNPSAKAAGGLAAWLGHHGRRPNDRHFHRIAKLAVLHLRRFRAEPAFRPVGTEGLATGQGRDGQGRKNGGKSKLHGVGPLGPEGAT